MSIRRIRKNDNVVAIAGVSAGRTGKVLEVVEGRALVEGLNLRKKALRRSQERPQGGIADKECPVALSNLMPYCPNCKRGVRISRVREAEKAIRKCRTCGHAFDA